MTKEYFLRLCTNHSAGFTSVDTNDLKKFFSQNVCILRGENRHPYADVLHEWIEGAEIECVYSTGTSSYMMTADKWFKEDGYRIKPSEPIYEWQWLMIPVLNGTNALSPYMTDDEFSGAMTSRGHKYIKVEETKRERK